MVTFHLGGVSASPLALADERGNCVIIRAASNAWAEKLARSATVAMGGHSMWAGYAMYGRDVRRCAVRGTLSLAFRLGHTVKTAQQLGSSPIEAVQATLNGTLLFRGKITDVVRQTTAGFARGRVSLAGLEDFSGSGLTIEFQNEHLIARRDGVVLATVPDLIVIMDAVSGVPITTEALRFGMRVAVVAAPCNPLWRTPAGLEVVGPAAFGYDVAYVPVEDLPRPNERSPRQTPP
jgi:DUF917 family protein